MPSFHARTMLGFLILAGTSASAGRLTFRVDSDKPGAIYAPGETMTFRVQLLEDGKPIVGRDLRYFDPVNHAERIKAQTVVDIGLGDYICPPPRVSAPWRTIWLLPRS